jgi:hypothetical protein
VFKPLLFSFQQLAHGPALSELLFSLEEVAAVRPQECLRERDDSDGAGAGESAGKLDPLVGRTEVLALVLVSAR